MHLSMSALLFVVLKGILQYREFGVVRSMVPSSFLSGSLQYFYEFLSSHLTLSLDSLHLTVSSFEMICNIRLLQSYNLSYYLCSFKNLSQAFVDDLL